MTPPADPDELDKPAPTDVSGDGGSATHESVEHLRAAARELIAAARSALDAAEEFVESPETSASLSEVAATVGSLVRSVVPGRRNAPGQAAQDDDPDDGGIERIPVT